jgi:CRP/FNR family transcriptional regulator, cyclic AMP receptor protein
MQTKNIGSDCLRCPVRGKQFLCDLSVRALEHLNDVKCRASYPKGAKLFYEGQPPRGAFVLCAGTVKLLTSSSQGRTIITRIAHPGDVLGLNAVVSSRPYGVSAEMMEPGQANFIPHDSLLQLMKDHGEVAMGVAKQLSGIYYTAHEEVLTLGLTHVAERLAQLLLSWSSSARQNEGGDDSLSFKLPLTHEEIAETIGATRECVSRLLCGFRKRQMLQLTRSSLWIKDRPALENVGRGEY